MKKILFIFLLSFLVVSCKKFDDGELPDLTLSQVFTSQDLAPGSSIKELIEIQNIGEGATESPIIFTVAGFPAGSGLSMKSDSSTDVTIGTDVFPLTNSVWDTVTTSAGLTFTSKQGVIFGPGEPKMIGLVISRAVPPNQGTDDTIRHSVTISSGSGGEKTDYNNYSSAVLTKTKAPDLTASQFFSSLQIPAGVMIQELVQIRNRGTGPTTAPISFLVTNYAASTGLTVTSNNNSSVTIGIDTYTITNATDWDISVTASTINFTSKAGVTIGVNGSKFIGINITRAAAPNQGSNGTITHTITIAPGTGGGETPITNNIVFTTLAKT